VFLGEVISKPAHEEPPGNAESKDERKNSSGLGLRVVLVQAEKQLEILLCATHSRNGAHATQRQQIEGSSLESTLHRLPRSQYLPFLGDRRLFEEERHGKSNDDDQSTQNP